MNIHECSFRLLARRCYKAVAAARKLERRANLRQLQIAAAAAVHLASDDTSGQQLIKADLLLLCLLPQDNALCALSQQLKCRWRCKLPEEKNFPFDRQVRRYAAPIESSCVSPRLVAKSVQSHKSQHVNKARREVLTSSSPDTLSTAH